MNMPRTNWPAGLLAAALFFGLLSQVSGPSEIEATQDLAAETREVAQRIEATQRRMDRAARALCHKVAGPDAVPVERIGGEIGCMPRGAL